MPDERLAKVVFYVQTLAVPAMRNVDDPRTARGAQLFTRADCHLCHILAKADPEDSDGDGISGRPNMVWDVFD